MFFVTYGGLSIYDGVKFKNYSQEDGLANELVNDIIEITPDSFLIATNSSSLNTLVRGKIGLYKTSDNFYPITNRFLKSNDGFLYVIADDGLFKFVENKFIQLPLEDASGTFIGGNLDRITEWNNYFLLIPWNSAQKEKLIIYNKESQVVTGSITEKTIARTAVSPKGELWVSSSTGIELLDLTALHKGNILLNPLFIEIGGDWKEAFIYFDHFDDGWIYLSNSALRITSS